MKASERERLFTAIGRPLFGGSVKPLQRRGIAAILDRFAREPEPHEGGMLAYLLATAHHETGRAMQPVRELGGDAYLTRLYDPRGRRPRLARANGNTTPGDGIRYAGRGFVQLTWKDNYIRVGALIGIDLAADPDRALELPIAAEILVGGMLGGWFTGRRLSEFIGAGRADWRNARQVVNGLDRADLIAVYAQAYLTALTAASAAPVSAPRSAAAPRPLSRPSRQTPRTRAR